MTEAREASDAVALARFLSLAGRLKRIPRTGWLDRRVPPAETESVADHSFRVALLAWVTAGPELDRDRVLALAMLHDLAEALTGDRTPYLPIEVPDTSPEARRAFLESRHLPDRARAAAKREAEAAAFAELTVGLPAPLLAELTVLWRELEARESPEARFVKQADRLETYLQSREYADRFPGLPVASFAAEVADTITDPGLVALRDAIQRGVGEHGIGDGNDGEGSSRATQASDAM